MRSIEGVSETLKILHSGYNTVRETLKAEKSERDIVGTGQCVRP